MNINSAVMEGAKILKNNFISTAYLDSEILMAKAINKNRDYIILNSKRILCKNDLNNFKKLINYLLRKLFNLFIKKTSIKAYLLIATNHKIVIITLL